MKKEKLSEEELNKIEEKREVALKNLDSVLWNYASPKLVSSEQYGKLSKLAEGNYMKTLSQTPSQDIYEQIFLPQLLSEGGAVTSPYVQAVSVKILQESIEMLKVEDVYGLMGIDKAMKKDYSGKYVFELSDEEVKNIIGSYMSFRTSDIVKGLLDMNKQGIKKSLEEMLCESEEQEKKSA